MPNLHPRRHIFHGHASGVSAHIRRPESRLLPVQGSSSLPVTGGFSESNLGPQKLDKWVSFEAVSTSAHGDYVDAAAGLATTTGAVAFDAAPTETRVRAAVHGLVILGRVHVAHAAMGLVSHSAVGQEQPVIRLEGNVLEGVRIDDSRLAITLAEEFYCECDTKDKLARRHSAGLAPHHARLFLPAVSGVDQVSGFPEAKGTVKCTIVQEIRWDGAPHPTATIHGHVVRVPNFGKIYFGEMFITGDSRRLTMVRFQLGSEDGGEVSAAEGETKPSTWPPV
ncbi:MAG: hypothetical protein NTW28_09595 [Candidatus Solibacter sp.]|nr:hypothetical protein [Candidatus Solibacter sp.]